MFKSCLRLGGALTLILVGLASGLLLPRPPLPPLTLPSGVGGGGLGPAAGPAHVHAGPTLEQVRGLAALTVLEVDVADVQVTDLRGYTGGARAALVVKGNVTLATDLSEARFASLDQGARTAVIVLPPPRVGNARLDHARTRLIGVWRDGLWQLAPGGDAAQAALVNRAYAEAQRVVEGAGQAPALDARARAQAESALRAFVGAMGWSLSVLWSDRPSYEPSSPTTRSAAESNPSEEPAGRGESMPSDQQVSARHVLQSLMRLKRQGLHRAMEELEQLEPDLAGYLMEELSLVQQKLLELGAPARRTRWLVRRVESLTLVCIDALRQGHYDLWRGDANGPLALAPGGSTDAECGDGPSAPPSPPRSDPSSFLDPEDPPSPPS